MTTVDGLGHSPLVRLANLAGSAARVLGRPIAPPDADALIAEAVGRVGVAADGDMAFEPVFRAAVAAARDAGLTPFGRFSVKEVSRRMLENRLRIGAELAQRPELAGAPVSRPIMIVGWYRSGTTLLHRLLSRARDVRAPLAWELYFPTGSDRTRRARMVRMLRLANLAIPELQRVHRIEADSPEEATVLLDNEALGIYFLHAFGAHGLGPVLADSDLGYAYTAMRRQLQLLSRPGNTRRWLLKCPFSMWKLDAFFHAFPDAQVVHIHRDPRESIGSVCSLAALLQHSFLASVDRAAIGRFWSNFYFDGREASRRFRTAHPEARVHDVAYEALVSDPAGVLAQLGAALDLDLPAADQPPAPPGAHHYDLAQFGLDDRVIAERFGG